jgi:hypothetical protein
VEEREQLEKAILTSLCTSPGDSDTRSREQGVVRMYGF